MKKKEESNKRRRKKKRRKKRSSAQTRPWSQSTALMQTWASGLKERQLKTRLKEMVYARIVSYMVASILLIIIAWVTLFLVSSVQSVGVFQALAIVCFEAVITCNKSFNRALVKLKAQWFNKVSARSGSKKWLTKVEAILKISAQNCRTIRHVHQIWTCVPGSPQPRKPT